jgi:hypothetical protein
MAATVARQQFFTAVAQLSGMNYLYQYNFADANTPEWIEFNAAKYVAQGDPLYVQTQMALGYTSAEMQFLFDLALHPVEFSAPVIRNRKGFAVLDRFNAEIETRPS